MKLEHIAILATAATLAILSGTAAAATWSDTSLGIRYGTKFAEPYVNKADGSRQDIKKTIVSITNASGYKYGSNYFTADFLLSDNNDPGNGEAGHPGAAEVYLLWRNTLDIGKVLGKDLHAGPVRGYGVTGGFDLDTKNDAYASKKRMVVIGPTVMFDVPGFLNASVLYNAQTNAPNGLGHRYHYKNHPELDLSWGIPLPFASVPLSFNGYASFATSKGKNEYGGQTAPETHFDADLMLDAGQVAGGPKGTFLVGVEYEYWHNKFGDKADAANAGPGGTASTPMVRVEYHF